MSGITGYPSQEKLTTPLSGYSEQNSKTTSQFVTVSETHDKHVVQDVRINGAFRTTALVKTLTSVATDFPLRVLKCTSHGAVKGDFIRFESSAANPYFGAMVLDAPDADTLIIGSTLPVTPVLGDEFFVYKHVVPLYDEDGTLSVSSGPLRFVRDAVSTQVVEDTVNPSNNIPLPVKLTSVTGDINITAGDLNVQLSDTGPNPDITRIGDGTNRLVMTAAGEATTYDATAEAELIDINAELDAQTALLTNIEGAALSIDTGFGALGDPTTKGVMLAAQDATANYEFLQVRSGLLQTEDPNLTAAVGNLATEATLALIEGKDFATETTLSAMAADVALIEGKDFATETTLLAMATDVGLLEAKDFATEATQALILADTNTLANATGIDDAAAPTGLMMIGGESGGNCHHVNVNNSGELLTRNNGIPTALGQQTSANSTSVVVASDAVLNTKPTRAKVDLLFNDYTLTSVSTAAYTQLIASTSAAASKVEVFDSSGECMILAVGAAASEVDQFYIFPGGNGPVELSIPSGSRISIKAKTATASSGFIAVNLYS